MEDSESERNYARLGENKNKKKYVFYFLQSVTVGCEGEILF